jgi:5-methylcytosine-specific restriction enzyme subunit McrC
LTITVAAEKSSESIQFTEYGIPIRNLWYMLLYAWNAAPMARNWQNEVESAPTLDILLASILAKLVQQRMRIGLGRSYMVEEQLVRGIRGRIDFAKSLKLRSFEKGKTYCRYQSYSPNVPKNQIVRSTLVRLVQTGDFGPNRKEAEFLRHRLRWLSRGLEGIDLIEVEPEIIQRQQLGRNDSDYRLMLAICELILQRQMPTDSTGKRGLAITNKDMLTLHRTYERFVANFYKIHLNGWLVKPQATLSWHAKYSGTHLPSMQPDLVLKEKASGRVIVLDTKFTARSLIANQWGGQVFDSGHLYQIYAYLRSQEHLSEFHGCSTGILLYPTIQSRLEENIALQDHQIKIASVDLAAPWLEIEQQLVNLIR